MSDGRWYGALVFTPADLARGASWMADQLGAFVDHVKAGALAEGVELVGEPDISVVVDNKTDGYRVRFVWQTGNAPAEGDDNARHPDPPAPRDP